MKKIICLIAFFGILYACGGSDSKDDDEPVVTEVDPSDSNQLAQAIIINGANEVNGSPPSPSNSPNAPAVNNNQSSATITNDNTLVLPFSYGSTTANGYGGCFVQIQGASFYWDIPNNSTSPQSGQILLSIGIPSTVLDGSFTVVYCIYDANGLVSNVLQTQVNIAPPKSCPGNESGSDGLTIFEYDLGSTAGVVKIDYDTYTIPDRIDVFYNDVWVDGTGGSLNSGEFPPQRNCNNASSSEGFVGDSGRFTVNHTPGNGNSLKVYVSGCIGGSTAWNVSVSCPE